MIRAKQAFDLVNRTLWHLGDELLPVAVLNLKEAHQIVRLEQHEANEAAIELLVPFYLVLKLASHVPVQLLFIHRQCQTLNHC